MSRSAVSAHTRLHIQDDLVVTVPLPHTEDKIFKIVTSLQAGRTLLTIVIISFLKDIFLPHVESGTITLIGATTENPSFSLNSALLSRCRVIVLEKLNIQHIVAILERTLKVIGAKIVKAEEKINFSKPDDKIPR